MRKNVRYLSLHDRDTWAPLTPQRVFAARYGDCKDQSQMLAVMLREAGVKAGVAIISWADSGDILESFPSPWGNHAIVLATIDGKEQWIDPVYSHAAWDVPAPEDCDRLCFVMDEKGPVRLVRTPKLRPEQNRVEQTTRVKVARDGSARGEREIIYRGVAAANERDELLSLPEGARQGASAQGRSGVSRAGEGDEGDGRSALAGGPRRAGAACGSSSRWTRRTSRPARPACPTCRSSTTCSPTGRPRAQGAAGRGPAVRDEAPLRRGAGAGLPLHRHGGIEDGEVGVGHVHAHGCSVDAGGRRVDVQSHLVMEKTRVEPGEVADFATFQKEVRDDYGLVAFAHESTDLADAAAMEAELTAAPGGRGTGPAAGAAVPRQRQAGRGRPRVASGVWDRPRTTGWPALCWRSPTSSRRRRSRARGQAHWQLARSASERKKWTEALDHLAKAGENDPAILLTADALDLKGRVCERLGKSREAMRAFEEMLILDPNDQRALPALIGLELAAKDRTKAMGHLRRYTVAVGGAAPGLATAADFHLRLDRLDDALDLATRSNQIGPVRRRRARAGIGPPAPRRQYRGGDSPDRRPEPRRRQGEARRRRAGRADPRRTAAGRP